MKPEKAISLLQRGIVGEIYDEKGYLTALGYEALNAIDRSKCPTLVQRPHGKWKQVTAKDGEYYCYHKCTNCGQTIESGFDNPPIFNFCPNCGADMRKKEGYTNDQL